jgi:hypothetical protein
MWKQSYPSYTLRTLILFQYRKEMIFFVCWCASSLSPTPQPELFPSRQIKKSELRSGQRRHGWPWSIGTYDRGCFTQGASRERSVESWHLKGISTSLGENGATLRELTSRSFAYFMVFGWRTIHCRWRPITWESRLAQRIVRPRTPKKIRRQTLASRDPEVLVEHRWNIGVNSKHDVSEDFCCCCCCWAVTSMYFQYINCVFYNFCCCWLRLITLINGVITNVRGSLSLAQVRKWNIYKITKDNEPRTFVITPFISVIKRSQQQQKL